jgi:hypothetical protein
MPKLVALAVLHRAQPEPPADPSPLRWWLLAEFLAFRRLALLTRAGGPHPHRGQVVS